MHFDPTTLDHPIRLLRIRKDINQSQLARMTGISRSTLIAIEDGRTREPSVETLDNLSRVLDTSNLGEQLAIWNQSREGSVFECLPEEVREVLALSPDELAEQFTSFQHWRVAISPTVLAFARLLGINHAHVSQYESGSRVRGAPFPIASAIATRLRVTDAYLVALEGLPPRG
jgi:transcriptional regulator with XRE-family HTH domain